MSELAVNLTREQYNAFVVIVDNMLIGKHADIKVVDDLQGRRFVVVLDEGKTTRVELA